jgi:hypothetical protein
MTKRYTDIDGKKHDLLGMCREHPVWAASVIRMLKNELYLALVRIPERTEAEEERVDKLWYSFDEHEQEYIEAQLRGDKVLPLRRED